MPLPPCRAPRENLYSDFTTSKRFSIFFEEILKNPAVWARGNAPKYNIYCVKLLRACYTSALVCCILLLQEHCIVTFLELFLHCFLSPLFALCELPSVALMILWCRASSRAPVGANNSLEKMRLKMHISPIQSLTQFQLCRNILSGLSPLWIGWGWIASSVISSGFNLNFLKDN